MSCRTAGMWLCALAALHGETRRALVVGNGDYKQVARVDQAAANARAMAAALTASEFQVSMLLNVEADPLGREVNRFLQELRPGDSAAFYFSGHAVQDMGENYLLPVGYSPASADGIEFQSYSVKRLVRYLETKKLSAGMVIIDGAAADEVMAKKFPEPGLASMDIRAANLVLAFANLPGRPVPAGPRRELGRYAEAWVAAAGETGMTLDAALRRIKKQISEATGGEQVPAEISTLVNEFSFQARRAAAVAWDRVGKSGEVAVLEEFRRQFPRDELAGEAGKRIEALEWERAKASGAAARVREFLGRYPRHSEALEWVKGNEASTTGAVTAAVERYRAAFESRDVTAVQAVRPSLTPAERKRLEEAFKNAKSVKYTLNAAGDPAIEGTVATVKCRSVLAWKFLREGDSPRPVEQTVTIKLRRVSEIWTVESIQ